MRTGCGGSFLRSDDFSLSVHTGFVFHSTRTGYCTSGSSSRSSFADRHRAGRIELRRKLPSFAAGSSVLDVTLKHGIPLGQLARVLRHPPLLILLRFSFYNPSISVLVAGSVTFWLCISFAAQRRLSTKRL